MRLLHASTLVLSILSGFALLPATASAADTKDDKKTGTIDDKKVEKPEAAPSEAAAAQAAPAQPAAPVPEAAPPASASEGAGASAGASASLTGGVDAGAAADAGNAPSAANPVEVAPGAFRCGADLHNGGHPEYVDRRCSDSLLEGKNIYISGGLELDLGYAKYTFDEEKNPQYPYEQFYDLRGRFVVGPTIFHTFQSGFFVLAKAQLVAWVRERTNDYQINVDDVYGQVGGPLTLPALGKAGNWDFQIGRFMTWRVYHKGLGFDLYTLEDNGAPFGPGAPTGNSVYATHMYEVNYIYLRNAGEPTNTETAGRAALHYYPTRSLGFELTGLYGQSNSEGSNAIGGRFAADYHDRLGPVLLRLSAGAEDRFERPYHPSINQTGIDTNGDPIYTECHDCAVQDHKGLGGGGIVKFSIVEVGGGFAKGWDITHDPTSNSDGSARTEEGTGSRMSYGGYLQLDPGTLLFKRPLILGAGLDRTEKSLDNRTYQEHWQGAAYIAFPIGFNPTHTDAMLKLVVSRAEASFYTTTSPVGAPVELTVEDTAMTSARLRFTYNFY